MKNIKKNSPPIPHLLQAQQALALLYAKVAGCPGIGSYPAPVQKCEIFVTQGQVNSKMSGLIGPKIELDRAFMPVLIISNFDDVSIKNEPASMETPFSHYKSMGNFLDAQGQLTP